VPVAVISARAFVFAEVFPLSFTLLLHLYEPRMSPRMRYGESCPAKSRDGSNRILAARSVRLRLRRKSAVYHRDIFDHTRRSRKVERLKDSWSE